MVYVHVLNHGEFAANTAVFLDSYRRCPPGHAHDTLVVFNNGTPTEADVAPFRFLPGLEVMVHDNSGWDIGAYLAASRRLDADLAVYFGNTAYVQEPDWMARMVQAAKKHGLGFYGSLGTYEVSPHLNTSGFWCDPLLVATYPLAVTNKPERYNFEHGPDALWRMVQREGLPALLVTWDGEYNWRDWRRPDHIYRRGHQGNCVTFFRHSTNFAAADPATKAWLSSLADTLVDPLFLAARSGQEVSL